MKKQKLIRIAVWAAGLWMGIPLAVGLGIALASVVPGDWNYVASIVAVLTMLGVLITVIQRVCSRLDYRFMRKFFPHFSGERFPVFHMTRYEGPDGGTDFDITRTRHSLGVTPDALFLIVNGTSRDSPHEDIGGDLVPSPTRPGFLHIRREEIDDVHVHDRNDDEIGARAVDDRSYEDRFADAFVEKFMKAPKTKLIPFAAFVFVRTRTPKGPGLFVFAVPTEVSKAMLEWLGEQPESDFDPVGMVVDKAKSEIESQVKGAIGSVIGKGITGFAFDAKDVLAATGYQIGSTKGAAGRFVANWIGSRIRSLAGGSSAST